MTTDKLDNRWKLPFFTIWTGQAFSLLGSQLVRFALIWYLTEQTGSATVLAAATTVTILPSALLGPFAGPFIDRWPHKWVLILSDAAIAVLTAMMGLLFALGVAQPWHVLVILFLRAVGDIFQNPTMQVTTATMVPRDWLPRVGGMNSTLQGALSFVAPGMGALLLATTDMSLILAMDVVTALVAIGPLFFIPLPQTASKPAGQRRNMWQDMGEAASTSWQKYITGLGDQWPSGVSPFEGLCHCLVEVVDECQNAYTEVPGRCETGVLEQTTDQDAEPDLDLIQPGSVFWCIDEADTMTLVS